MPLNVLIIGGGSIGERHLRCFGQNNSCTVSICEVLDELRERLVHDYGTEGFSHIDEAAERSWDLVVVATPANWHIPHAIAFKNSTKAWLIEKPLSTGLDRIDEFRAASSKKVLGIGYVLRSHPATEEVRKIVKAKTLGEPLQLTIVSGQHFPTFRPAYREIYYTSHRTGGGAIQDGATHLLDLAHHLVGRFDSVFCDYAHQALEGVEVEDTVHLTARAARGKIMVNLAFNQFMAPNETIVQVNAKEGSVRLLAHEHRYGVMRLGETDWTWSKPLINERDDLFRRQAKYMLEACQNLRPVPCTLEEAIHTLQINQAALASAGERVVHIEQGL